MSSSWSTRPVSWDSGGRTSSKGRPASQPTRKRSVVRVSPCSERCPHHGRQDQFHGTRGAEPRQRGDRPVNRPGNARWCAYLPALSDVLIMVDKTSFMGLGGPNLVKGATGQSTDQETLGGARISLL